MFQVDHTVTGLVDKTPVLRRVSRKPPHVPGAIANAVRNLDEPQATANHLLQRRPANALREAARFVINSTLGVGGLFDVAKKMGLRRVDADFGQTLASYGVKPGAYIYLPIAGPSSVRDVVGQVVDGYFWPVSWLRIGQLPLQAANAARAGLEHTGPGPQSPPSALAAAKPAPKDAYIAARLAYQETLAPPASTKRVRAVRRLSALATTTVVAANP